MKKRLPIIACGVILVATLATAAFASAVPSYEDQLNAQVQEYTALSKSELVTQMSDEFNMAVAQGDVNALIPIASVFSERLEEFTQEELIGFILDNTYPDFLRETYVQLLAAKTSFTCSDSRLIGLLSDTEVPASIQQSILSHFGAPDATLEQLVLEAQDGVAFHAMKKLAVSNPDMAYALSRDILNDFESKSDGHVMSAVRVFSQVTAGDIAPARAARSAQSDEALLYDVVGQILQNSDSPTLKDSVVFSLADTQTTQAVDYIIHNEAIDDIMKKTTVDRNYETLMNLLDDTANIEEIQLVTDCMEIWPMKDLAEPLTEVLSNLPATYSAEVNAAVQVLDLIANEGIESNPKWKN